MHVLECMRGRKNFFLESSRSSSNGMLTTKKVRGYLLQVEEAPATFDGLLAFAQQWNELAEPELVKALSASAVNNEYQHPAAERFVMYHAEYICSRRYSMSLTDVLKSKKLHFNDASSVVKEAKSEFAVECKHKVGSEEWQASVDKGEACNYLFSLEQAQQCWDEQVKVFSGLGKKPKSVSIGEKAVWKDRKVTAEGFLKAKMSVEQIVSLVGIAWGGAEAVEAFMETVMGEFKAEGIEDESAE